MYVTALSSGLTTSRTNSPMAAAQVNMAAASRMNGAELTAAFNSLPKQDVFAALDYYFENLNDGRPFILAGHSQGSAIQSLVLAEYMKAHPEYLERMVAAYVIGYSITGDYLKANPHLKFAEKLMINGGKFLKKIANPSRKIRGGGYGMYRMYISTYTASCHFYLLS